jgi:hypothetical protein
MKVKPRQLAGIKEVGLKENDRFLLDEPNRSPVIRNAFGISRISRVAQAR